MELGWGLGNGERRNHKVKDELSPMDSMDSFEVK